MTLFRRPSDVDSAADDVAMAVDTDPRLETGDFDLEIDLSLSMKFRIIKINYKKIFASIK